MCLVILLWLCSSYLAVEPEIVVGEFAAFFLALFSSFGLAQLCPVD